MVLNNEERKEKKSTNRHNLWIIKIRLETFWWQIQYENCCE